MVLVHPLAPASSRVLPTSSDLKSFAFNFRAPKAVSWDGVVAANAASLSTGPPELSVVVCQAASPMNAKIAEQLSFNFLSLHWYTNTKFVCQKLGLA